jgi:hypothetical protein
MLKFMCLHICIKLYFITARLVEALTNQLAQCCEICLGKFTVAQPARTHMFSFILNGLNPAHTLMFFYSMIHFNVIFWSKCRYSILLRCFLIKIRHVPIFLIFFIHSTCPTYCILLDFITQIIICKKYKLLTSSSCNCLFLPVTAHL